MAISWGSWEYGNSSAGFRVGVETSVSSVSSGSSSVTITMDWYVEAMYNVNDSMVLTYGGSISGSSTQNLTTGSSGGVKFWQTKTYTYSYSTYGSSPGTRTFSASLSDVYNGATPTKSFTWTIPARPYAVPAAPSGVTAVRGASDASITVSWTRNATTAAPYTSVTVQRRKWEGSGGWGSWATIATTSSTATSFVDTAGDPNTARQYQVRANNSAGSSAYVQAATTVKLTPAAVTNVAAALVPAGNAITVTWANNHYTGQGNLIKIQRSVAGGAYADVVTGLAETTTSWTDSTPGAGTNTYKVLVVTNGTPVLTSADALSNTVSTTVPPLAPTNLSPNGVAVDFTQAQVLSWQHNPGGDQAAQSSFILQTSIDGGTNWVTKATVTSTVSSWTMPGGTHTNGQSVLWRVQTRGVTAAGYGPNSASATLTGSATPVTTITGPPTTVTTLPAPLVWTYSQAQSSAQSAWEAELLLTSGSTLLEAKSGTTALTTTFATPLVDGTAYTMRVRTRSTAGIWSAWATRNLTLSLLPPAHVTVAAQFQPTTGTTVVSLAATAAGAGEVAVTSATVERRVPGGDWVTLIAGVALPNDVLDLLPATRGTTEYRVTAKSNTPTYRQEAIVSVTPANALTDPAAKDLSWIFVNYGPAFTNVLRFRSEPDVAVSTSREKAGRRFVGRSKPLAQFGEGRSREVSVKGSLFYAKVDGDESLPYDSPPIEWELAGEEAEIVCYRDFFGRRIFGTLEGVGTSEEKPGLGAIGFGVTETDYEEVYG